MKRLIVFILFLCSATPLVSLDLTSNVICPTESDADAVLDHEQSLVTSFSNFINNFVALLSEKTDQAKIILHQMIYSVLEICHQLTTSKKTIALGTQNDNLFTIIDQQLLDTLSNVATNKALSITMIKNKQTNTKLNAKHKADVQKILNFFAGVVQNFFTIVQDPENKQNVTQGVIGMLGNIVAAGNTIINDTQQNNGPVPLEQIVETMDEATKQEILNLIQARRQFIRIQA